jgi:O-antigen/teichoic acid export membrane protein
MPVAVMPEMAVVVPVPTVPPVRAETRQGMRGFGWMSLAQAAGLALRLGSSLVLSRLLAPEAYGTIGPALAVLMTLEWFCDMGIRPALVRDPLGGTPAFLLTGWWMGLVRAVGLGVIAAGLALPMARFVDQPGLTAVLATLALLPLFQALRSPGLPVLRRQLNYRAVFIDETGQLLVGITVTLASAWWLRSVWAIVAGTLGGAAAGIVISYWLRPMWPAWCWDRTAYRRLLHSSKQILANTLLMALWYNSDRVLGLRLVSLEEMGLYTVAWNLAAVLDTLLGRACDVYFSLLSRTLDPGRQAIEHERVCLRVAAILMPCLALGVGLAPWLIRILYDARYLGAGLLFALLVARLMFRTLGQVQFQHLLARAEIRVATVSYGAALLTQAVLLVPMTRHWEGLGLAASALISTAVLTVVQSVLLWRRGDCRLFPMLLTFGWALVGLLLLALFGRTVPWK